MNDWFSTGTTARRVTDVLGVTRSTQCSHVVCELVHVTRNETDIRTAPPHASCASLPQHAAIEPVEQYDTETNKTINPNGLPNVL